MKDAFKKGRLNITNLGTPFTVNNVPKNRLLKSPEEVLDIKEKIKNKSGSLKELSEQLNLPYTLIRDINCGRVYKDL